MIQESKMSKHTKKRKKGIYSETMQSQRPNIKTTDKYLIKAEAEALYEKYLAHTTRLVGSGETYDEDLNKAAKSLFHKKYMGTFPADKIPVLIPPNKMLIANLDDANESGSHWVAVAKDKKKNIWVYDSFARDIHKILPSIYIRNRKIKTTEKDKEQKDAEDNCGARVLAWLMIYSKHGPKFARWI